MSPALKLCCGVFVLWLTALSAFGQAPDRHLSTYPAHELYRNCAFAHGYIHGYEDGFHNADLDIHMGRNERSLSSIKEFRDSGSGYDRSFGDKQFFSKGYKQGFSEGYSDAIRGGEFRAVEETRKAADGFRPPASADVTQKDFDQAFAGGYDLGRRRGLVSASLSSELDRAANACASRSNQRKPQYCDAFVRGFTLGFSDGQTDRVKRRTQTARK